MLSIPERHQLRIARDTLKLSGAGARIMGGPDEDEARQIIFDLTGRWPLDNSFVLPAGARFVHVDKRGGQA